MRRDGIRMAYMACMACVASLSMACLMACDGSSVDAIDAAIDAANPAPDMGPDVAPAPVDAAQPPPHPYADHPLLRPGPLAIAHRGGRALGPECTLFTYERAWAAGADVLEADVHLTADGAVIIMHDHEVDRTTDGEGVIAELTLEQIKALEAGYNHGREDGYPYRGQGLRVPTLDELLTALPDAPISLEIKQDDPPMIDALLAVLDAHDARGRVLVAAYAESTLDAFREAAPDVLTAMAANEVLEWILLPAGPDAGPWQPAGHFFQVPLEQAGFTLVTAETLAHAHRHGVRMHPYTIDDAAEMARLLDLGVDGLMTDDPETLRAVIDNR